jgi:hypothetical protein
MPGRLNCIQIQPLNKSANHISRHQTLLETKLWTQLYWRRRPALEGLSLIFGAYSMQKCVASHLQFFAPDLLVSVATEPFASAARFADEEETQLRGLSWLRARHGGSRAPRDASSPEPDAT